MQIWIYFLPGAGGDGFANLLEHASNVKPIDSDVDPKRWRVHRFVDDQPKFYANAIDNIRCFRNNRPFLSAENQLRSNYVRLVKQGIPTICTSHDVTLANIQKSDCRDILEHNKISVFLYHDSYRLCVYQAALKNLEPKLPPMISDDYYPIRQKINMEDFDHVLNIADIQSNWNTVNDFCQTVGLDLNQERYQEYCQLQQGQDEWYRARYSKFVPQRFKSHTDNGVTTYTEI